MSSMTMTKPKTLPPLPDEDPRVVEAQRRLIDAIGVHEAARAREASLYGVLNDPHASPHDQQRARIALPRAEEERVLAEMAAQDAQRDVSARRSEAVEAWRPVFTQRYREALQALDAVFTEHVLPANEEVRAIWYEAYELGVKLPEHFWAEFISPSPAIGSRLHSFWRPTLQREGWLDEGRDR